MSVHLKLRYNESNFKNKGIKYKREDFKLKRT